jgi:hypothetical protein
MEFKVWDKVRCISDYWYQGSITVWKIYEVIYTEKYDIWTGIVNDEWFSDLYNDSRFELLQEDKLPHELV